MTDSRSCSGCHGLGPHRLRLRAEGRHEAPSHWREPYDADELADFRSLVDQAGTCASASAISPGLIDRRRLAVRPGRARGEGRLRRRSRRRPRRALLSTTSARPAGPPPNRAPPTRASAPGWPTTSRAGRRSRCARRSTSASGPRPTCRPSPKGCPTTSPSGGPATPSSTTQSPATQAQRRAEALGGRPPLLWDNVPVNDGVMCDRLHLGPLWGRDRRAGRRGVLTGWLANPMIQPTASLLPLASIAAWCIGDDPLECLGGGGDRTRLAGVRRGVRRRRTPAARPRAHRGGRRSRLGRRGGRPRVVAGRSGELHRPRTRVRRRPVAPAGSRGGRARAASLVLDPRRRDRGSRSARTARPAPSCPTPLACCGTRSQSRPSGRSCVARSPPCSVRGWACVLR